MQLSTIAPFGFSDFPERLVLPFICSCRIGQVQVVRDFQIKLPAAEIMHLLNDYGLRAESFHADHGEHVDLASSSSLTRRQAVDKLAAEAEFALDIETDVIVAHPCGTKGPTDPAGSDNFCRSAEMLARTADDLSVTILIENMPPEFAHGVETAILARDLQNIGSNRLGLCFDTGHAHMSHLPVVQQIDDTQGYMHYLHASDNDGSDDQHILPFAGSIDWPAVGEALKQIDYDGIFCLEVFEPVDVLREKLTDRWWQRFYASIDCQAQR